MLATLSSVLLATNSQDRVLDFLKKGIVSNQKFDVKKISITSSQDLKDIPNWKAYFVDIDVFLKKEKKEHVFKDIVFSDGKYFSRDFISVDERSSIKSSLAPKAKTSLYDKSHLLAGNENAKNKLLVFSDPNCPFCMNFVPFVIDAAKKYPNEFVVYYYDFPLNIHKSAKGFIKATLAAEKQGLKDAVYKMYKARLRSSTDDEKEIAKIFNKALKTNVTVKQMNEKWILKRIESDIKIANSMMIDATPTLFVNGKKDAKRETLKALYDKVNKK